jgi:hypothetical protein
VVRSCHRIVPARHVVGVVVRDRIAVEPDQLVPGSDDRNIVGPVPYRVVAVRHGAVGRQFTNRYLWVQSLGTDVI